MVREEADVARDTPVSLGMAREVLESAAHDSLQLGTPDYAAVCLIAVAEGATGSALS